MCSKSKPDDEKHPAPLDYNGTALITVGMGLSVLALQQSSIWGWGDAKTIGLIAQEVSQLVLGLSLRPTGGLSHNPLATAVVANRGRCNPPLPVLIPMQTAVPAGTTSHARPPSESTYSDSADTGTNRRRPCFTVRSRPERISS